MINKQTAPQDLSTLAELVEGNAVEGCLAWAAWGELELHETRELTWTITSIPFPLLNNVLRAQLPSDGLDDHVRAALSPFKQRELPCAWWVGPSSQPSGLADGLEAYGMAHAATMVGMAADLGTLRDDMPIPRGVEISEVVDEERLSTWCGVLGQVHAFPDLALGPWRRLHEAMGLGPGRPWRHFVATLDGRAVATSSLFMGRRAVSVANIATARDVRGRGIGRAMSLYPLLEAKRQGQPLATLCASRGAVALFRRLGFEHACELELFLAPSLVPDSESL